MGELSSPGALLCAGPGEGGPGKEEKQPLVNVGVRQRCFGSQGKYFCEEGA